MSKVRIAEIVGEPFRHPHPTRDVNVDCIRVIKSCGCHDTLTASCDTKEHGKRIYRDRKVGDFVLCKNCSPIWGNTAMQKPRTTPREELESMRDNCQQYIATGKSESIKLVARETLRHCLYRLSLPDNILSPSK